MLFPLFIIYICYYIAKSMTMLVGPNVQQLTPPVDLAECPTWDSRTNRLYYVDIFNGKVYSYDYQSKEINSIKFNGNVAPVIPSKTDPNRLIIGVNTTIISVNWNGSCKKNEKILVELPEKSTNRLNDGKADSNGRLWFGTMGFQNSDGEVEHNQGTLYKIDRNLKVKSMISPLNISNGLTWNKDNTKFYYIDSPTKKIVEYDFDADKGLISNPKSVFAFESIEAIPDGMTIDRDDNLWIALYDGGSVIQVNPKTQKLLRRIPIPAVGVTSVIWGGPKLDILFVTTSKHFLSPKEREQQPGAGSIFAVTGLGTKGFEPYRADLKL